MEGGTDGWIDRQTDAIASFDMEKQYFLQSCITFKVIIIKSFLV